MKKKLNFDSESPATMHDYLSKDATLDFEENEFVQDALEEIMGAYCQDNNDAEIKRIDFKIKFNSIDEKEIHAINCTCLIKYCDVIVLHGNEMMTYHSSETNSRKDSIDWRDLKCRYERNKVF